MTILGWSTSVMCGHAQAANRAEQSHPGEVWLDTSGQPISAHGGGSRYYRGVYYWFGQIMEVKTVQGCMDITGIPCYSSPDIYHWKNNVLPAVKNDSSSDLAPGIVVGWAGKVMDEYEVGSLPVATHEWNSHYDWY